MPIRRNRTLNCTAKPPRHRDYDHTHNLNEHRISRSQVPRPELSIKDTNPTEPSSQTPNKDQPSALGFHNPSSHTQAISRNETPRHQQTPPTTHEIKIPGEQHTLRPQFPATSLSNVGGWSGNRNSKIRAPWRPVAAFNCTTAGVWAMEWNNWDVMGWDGIQMDWRSGTQIHGWRCRCFRCKTLEGGVEEVTWREHFRLGFHPYCHPRDDLCVHTFVGLPVHSSPSPHNSISRFSYPMNNWKCPMTWRPTYRPIYPPIFLPS